jgi:PAS domain S-box-containing protein
VEERLHFQSQVLAHVSDAVFTTDGEGRISFWGRGAEKLYGIPAAEAVGRPATDVFQTRWASREEEREALAALAKEGCWRGENVHVLASGEEIRVESTLSVLRGTDDEDRGLLAVVRDVSAHKRTEERLRDSREQLRALASRIQSIREDEKTRVARDLHDELGDVLTALRMELRTLEAAIEAMEPEVDAGPLLDRVVEASALATRALAAVKRLALELRPGALDRLGLDAALRQEVRRFQDRTGIPCDADVPDLPTELAPEVATALYRICQEAMTNVVRHAQAAHVRVRLDVGRDHATLEIEDDGRGIDPRRVATPLALGMLGMVERAKALGGDVSFRRGPARGTVVTATIPLDERRIGRSDRRGTEMRSFPGSQDVPS